MSLWKSSETAARPSGKTKNQIMTTILKNTILLTFSAERVFEERLDESIIDSWDRSDGWKCGGTKTVTHAVRVPTDTVITVSVATVDETVKNRVESAITAANSLLRETGLNRMKLPDYDGFGVQIPCVNKLDCTFELEGHPDLSALAHCNKIFVHKGIKGWYPDSSPTGCPFFGLDGELRSDIDAFPDPAEVAEMETVFNLALMYLEEKGYIIDNRYSQF